MALFHWRTFAIYFCPGYRKSALTEDQLKKKQQRDNKRKQMAHEKREKDKVQISFATRKPEYYIFEAILILFLVIFEDDKSDNFLRGDKYFRMLKRTESRQKTVKMK